MPFFASSFRSSPVGSYSQYSQQSCTRVCPVAGMRRPFTFLFLNPSNRLYYIILFFSRSTQQHLSVRVGHDTLPRVAKIQSHASQTGTRQRREKDRTTSRQAVPPAPGTILLFPPSHTHTHTGTHAQTSCHCHLLFPTRQKNLTQYKTIVVTQQTQTINHPIIYHLI